MVLHSSWRQPLVLFIGALPHLGTPVEGCALFFDAAKAVLAPANFGNDACWMCGGCGGGWLVLYLVAMAVVPLEQFVVSTLNRYARIAWAAPLPLSVQCRIGVLLSCACLSQPVEVRTEPAA